MPGIALFHFFFQQRNHDNGDAHVAEYGGVDAHLAAFPSVGMGLLSYVSPMLRICRLCSRYSCSLTAILRMMFFTVVSSSVPSR